MGLAFEQLPRESNKAFAAFRTYLEMGPQRSMAEVGRKLGKSEGLIERWSRKYDWAGRVSAYGAHLATVEREATEALVRVKSAEWLKRQQEVREREWEMHEKCIAAAKRALAAFMERDKVYANLADIARILEVGSKMGRMASGLATETVEHTGEVDVNFRLEVEAAVKKVYGEVVEAEVTSGQGSGVSEKPAVPALPGVKRELD
jgi:hypothetical protein